MIKLTMTTNEGDTIEVANHKSDPGRVILKVGSEENNCSVVVITDDESTMLSHFFERVTKQ
jgi:hypothetical protein